jgi:hypothetical protein
MRWAFAGAQAVGKVFGRWIEATTFATWDDLIAAAVPQLAMLNGSARGTAELARTQTEAVDVLLVGYLAGEGRIMYLDDEGGGTEVDDDVIFLGGGAPFAYVGWEVALRLIPASTLLSRSTFDAVLSAVVERIPMLGSPAQVHELLP